MGSAGPLARYRQDSGPEPDVPKPGEEFSKKEPKSRMEEKEGCKPPTVLKKHKEPGSHLCTTEPQPGVGPPRRGPPKGPVRRSKKGTQGESGFLGGGDGRRGPRGSLGPRHRGGPPRKAHGEKDMREIRSGGPRLHPGDGPVVQTQSPRGFAACLSHGPSQGSRGRRLLPGLKYSD